MNRIDYRKRALIDELIAQARAADGNEQLAQFLMLYYRMVPEEDLLEAPPDELLSVARGHWELGLTRQPGELKLRIFQPRQDEHGWNSAHTVIEIVNDDMPFLVDTLVMILAEEGMGVEAIIHPIMVVERDEQARIVKVLEPRNAAHTHRESYVHIECTGLLEPAQAQHLENKLCEALDDVRVVVNDWPEMNARIRELAQEYDVPSQSPHTMAAELPAFLRWLTEDHFTFIGYAEYQLQADGQLVPLPEHNLGIRRKRPDEVQHLPPPVLRRFQEPEVLLLTKASELATVHRRTYLDMVSIKRFGETGEVTGECRLLGLYTSSAYYGSLRETPLLRTKVARIIERSGLLPASHSGKVLLHILEILPREELFQASEDELFEMAMSVLQLEGRQRARLLLRRDPFGRFYSAIVLIPRERYEPQVVTRIEQVLRQALRGSEVESNVHVGDSAMAQIYVSIRGCPPDMEMPSLLPLEQQVIRAVRSWYDELRAALIRRYGEVRGGRLLRRYRMAFSAGYRTDFEAEAGVEDIERIESLKADTELQIHLYQRAHDGEELLRLKIYHAQEPLALSDVLPQLENMGLRVLTERPYEIHLGGERQIWLQEFELRALTAPIPVLRVRALFEQAFLRIWFGDAENDGFNRLLLAAQLNWRQISVLRAIYKYLVQAGAGFSQSYAEQALFSYPNLARLLVQLFERRFDPAASERRDLEVLTLIQALDAELDKVVSLDHDRILRAYLDVVRACLRTNYFQTAAAGIPKDYLAFKLDPKLISSLPKPLPLYEIFVCSPRVEGVHLRGGKIARGGIRWSDRREDFRTEVLGLMKAQMVKNTVIVPVGAKGGFVVKRPPASGERKALQEEGIACYRIFISGLLDLTDNYVNAEVVPPPSMVRYDDDDPYLVVAADKGTASFSDIANEIARTYGYWLDDAFASGGSTGYDHKKMAITSRGAWESVKRHFHEMGRVIEQEDFTVVGIGDMSGDVFGNGMLRSPHIRLIAAFNHRHIFIDPDPDPQASFAERKRLFELPGSQWSDYDSGLISAGGGVFERSAKRIQISPQIQKALDIGAQTLTPIELIRAILRAPVDLLWNGGIGTYVKSSAERNAEVGDRSNDLLRINGRELRCKVVGEGGNLGFTQLGRIEYALQGGRINTDFIDNSAGVDCSDHEVNIKILLNAAVEDGELSMEARNRLLMSMADEVAALVLRDNYLQNQALSLMNARATELFDEHVYLMQRLEPAGLDRAIEFLPNDEQIGVRRKQNLGFTRPELAVLLSYSKITVYDGLLESKVPEDPYLAHELALYFPKPLQTDYARWMDEHRLRRAIIANGITNSMINRMGISFAQRLMDDMAATVADVARAYTCAREIFRARQTWAAIEALDGKVKLAVQQELILVTLRLVEQGARWFLSNPQEMTDIAQAVARYSSGLDTLSQTMNALLRDEERAELEAKAQTWLEAGVPQDLAQWIIHMPLLQGALDMIDIAEHSQRTITQVAEVYFALGDALDMDWLFRQLDQLNGQGSWTARARYSLRYDLEQECKRLMITLLQTSDTVQGKDVQAWLQARGVAIQHFNQLLQALHKQPELDLAAIILVLRELRQL